MALLSSAASLGKKVFKKHLFVSNLSISFVLSGLGDFLEQSLEQVIILLYFIDLLPSHRESNAPKVTILPPTELNSFV